MNMIDNYVYNITKNIPAMFLMQQKQSLILSYGTILNITNYISKHVWTLLISEVQYCLLLMTDQHSISKPFMDRDTWSFV
jgi:hypothetical protein